MWRERNTSNPIIHVDSFRPQHALQSYQNLDQWGAGRFIILGDDFTIDNKGFFTFMYILSRVNA